MQGERGGALPVATLSLYLMLRTTRTLHGSRYAVLALLVATAALAFDLGRSACPKPALGLPTLTRAAL